MLRFKKKDFRTIHKGTKYRYTANARLSFGASTTDRGNAHAMLQGRRPAITITDISRFTASVYFFSVRVLVISQVSMVARV